MRWLVTEPPKFSVPRWVPFAAAAAAGLAAATVAWRCRPAVAEEPEPLPPPEPEPEPPVEMTGRSRFRAILTAMAIGVLAVWIFAIHTNNLAESACAEARRSADPWDSARYGGLADSGVLRSYSIDHTSDVSAVRCVGRR
jgi:hypothetical protein